MKRADARLEKSDARYKRDFDKRVRQLNTGLKPGDLFFVKRETATESEERNRPARGAAIGHHKLRSKATGRTKWSRLPLQPLRSCETDSQTKSQEPGRYVHPTLSAKTMAKRQKAYRLILQTARPPMSSYHLLEDLRVLPETQCVILRTERLTREPSQR